MNAPAIILPRKAIARIRHQRIITMPPGMEPEWLAPQYRDNYVQRCIQLFEKLFHCSGCRRRRRFIKYGLRKFQRGNFSAFPAGTQALVAGCSFTASTIPNLFEFNLEPTDSYTRARLHSDGDWYSAARTTSSWESSEGTWQGSCAVADYQTRWNRNSGDVPNNVVSGSDGVWSVATTSKAVGYVVTTIGNLNGSFDLECREGTGATLFTDAFTMNCEVDSFN